MKTAISIPDEVFRSADRLAQHLGLSRSELYARAVAHFVARHRRDNLRERLNALYPEPATPDEPDRGLAALQARSLPRDDAW